jgi:hypothetical protein
MCASRIGQTVLASGYDVTPSFERSHFGLHRMKQIANPLRSISFEDEVGEVTLLRGLQSESVDIAFDEPYPTWLQILGTEHVQHREPPLPVLG